MSKTDCKEVGFLISTHLYLLGLQYHCDESSSEHPVTWLSFGTQSQPESETSRQRVARVLGFCWRQAESTGLQSCLVHAREHEDIFQDLSTWWQGGWQDSQKACGSRCNHCS